MAVSASVIVMMGAVVVPAGMPFGPGIALADGDDDDDGIPNAIDNPIPGPPAVAVPRSIDRTGDGDARSNLDRGDRQTIIECVEEVLLRPAWLRQACDEKLAAIERRSQQPQPGATTTSTATATTSTAIAIAPAAATAAPVGKQVKAATPTLTAADQPVRRPAKPTPPAADPAAAQPSAAPTVSAPAARTGG